MPKKLLEPSNADVSALLVMQALSKVHVNLVDLVDARCRGRKGDVKIYKTVHQLREYTFRTKKIFPKQNAKAGGVLRALLRQFYEYQY